MHRAVIDHRSQKFARLGSEVLENLRPIFQTAGPVVIYPSSGTGAWEASIVNTLSPGDRVLMFETGHFSQLWRQLTEKFGIEVDYVPGNWRRGASAEDAAARLDADQSHTLKAVIVVHLFGNVAPVAEIEALGVPVLEDAAQAAGSTSEHGRPGSLGAAATFSFYPSKNLGCFGDGGIVTTNCCFFATSTIFPLPS